jgi:polyhydroxyalkanoate synthesis repressor PhaR
MPERLDVRFLVAMHYLHQKASSGRLTHRTRIGPPVSPTAPEIHLIKKYANRKLYDTRTSRYVTLEGVAQLVREGHEIKVVDRDNGQDLTQLTLSQIVLEEEKRGPARIVDAGGELLHDRGQALLDYVRRTLNVPAEIRTEVGRRRDDLESMADETIERALRRLRIPTRRDIDRINERLDRLAAEVRRANGSTTRPRKRPSRK